MASAAFARWDTAFFSARLISPNVRGEPRGTKIGSKPKPPRPLGVRAIAPSHTPRKIRGGRPRLPSRNTVSKRAERRASPPLNVRVPAGAHVRDPYPGHTRGEPPGASPKRPEAAITKPPRPPPAPVTPPHA